MYRLPILSVLVAVASLLAAGCGLLLDVAPPSDGDAPPDSGVVPGPVFSSDDCDYFVFLDAEGSGDTMADASGDLPATALRAGAEGGGVVCVASRTVDGACRGTNYPGPFEVDAGVMILGGFQAAQEPWTWEPGCRPTLVGGGADTTVVFVETADENSSLAFLNVRVTPDLDQTVAVMFLGGGAIVHSDLRANGVTQAVAVAGATAAGQPIVIEDTQIRMDPASPVMSGIIVQGRPLFMTRSSIRSTNGAEESSGVALIDAAGSQISGDNRIHVGTADEIAIAIGIRGASEGVMIEDNLMIRIADSSLVDEVDISAAIVTAQACSGTVRIEDNRNIVGGGPRGLAETNVSAAVVIQGCLTTIRGNSRIVGRDEPGVGRAAGVVCTGDCIIEDNRIVGAETDAQAADVNVGVLVYNGTAEVRSNDIEACRTGGRPCYGVVASASDRTVIAANEIRGPEDAALYAGIVLRASSVEVVNNRLRTPVGLGIFLEDDHSETASTNEALIHFNTFVFDSPAPTYLAFAVAVTDRLSASSVSVRNNLVACMGSSGEGAMIRQAAADGPVPMLSHNAVYGCGAALSRGQPIELYTVADLESAVLGGADTATIELTESPFAGTAYRLDRSSAAVDAALATEDDPSTDIEGDARDAAPDIGADEAG